jgi:hypothetical protein
MKTYRAPWGKTLRWSSAGLILLTVAIVAGMSWLPANAPGWSKALATWCMPVVVLACLPFVVRGYTITGEAILIHRLFWTTRLNRSGLTSAAVVPRAMNSSLRTCGNGGGFSFTGWYWNQDLGAYRAFVTDLNRTVVLRFGKRAVVVSPEAPEDFVAELNRR